MSNSTDACSREAAPTTIWAFGRLSSSQTASPARSVDLPFALGIRTSVSRRGEKHSVTISRWNGSSS